MRILICSDGSETANQPTRLGALVAGPAQADVTLLGIAENAEAATPLRAALKEEAELLQRAAIEPEITERTGEPIEEIMQQTRASDYDLVVIGARTKRRTGLYWRSPRTYGVIKSIAPPVLLATGDCERLSSFLVCTGGKKYIEAAVQLTGEIAAALGAKVTLLHVMAEPPAMYAALAEAEENVESLLASGSELGQNLRAQKERLENLGAPTEVRVRHGNVLEQVFAEQRAGGHDLIVTGSSRSSGALQNYIMGDLTRGIVNRTNCPVLVARSEGVPRGWWSKLKQIFGRPA
ncbi:MAG: universal stress protein [Chthoniobacterales bacterium]